MPTVLITGANRGIGLEMARQCAARGYEGFAACRQSSLDLDELGVQVISGVDVDSDESVAMLAKSLDGARIDWLVNNAGILERTSLDKLDFESMERQFRINALGPLRVTAALRGHLAQGSKVFARQGIEPRRGRPLGPARLRARQKGRDPSKSGSGLR